MELERKKLKMTKIDKAYSLILDWIKNECSNGSFDEIDEGNFEGTDKRAAKAFAEMVRPKDEIAANCRSMMKSFKIDENQDQQDIGPVTQGPIDCIGLCPHHLLPVQYEVYVSYIPKSGKNAKVLGLSKLARLAQEISKFPMLQEDYAKHLADVLYQGNDWLTGVNSAGCAVTVIGQHGCMLCRGVKSKALTEVTITKGIYRENNLEQKFKDSINAIRMSSLRRM